MQTKSGASQFLKNATNTNGNLDAARNNIRLIGNSQRG
jgi:hypothetical protein